MEIKPSICEQVKWFASTFLTEIDITVQNLCVTIFVFKPICAFINDISHHRSTDMVSRNWGSHNTPLKSHFGYWNQQFCLDSATYLWHNILIICSSHRFISKANWGFHPACFLVTTKHLILHKPGYLDSHCARDRLSNHVSHININHPLVFDIVLNASIP